MTVHTFIPRHVEREAVTRALAVTLALFLVAVLWFRLGWRLRSMVEPEQVRVLLVPVPDIGDRAPPVPETLDA